MEWYYCGDDVIGSSLIILKKHWLLETQNAKVELKTLFFKVYVKAFPLLGIYPKEMKTDAETKSCTQMFIAALFIIAQR